MDSGLWQRVGKCNTDEAGIAADINRSQEILLPLAGDTGWVGSWVKVVWNVDREEPEISLPPSIARIINLDVCRAPVRVNNQWIEFLWGSHVRLQDVQSANCGCQTMQAFDRGYFPTAYDIPEGSNSLLRVYTTDARDNGAQIFFAGAKDQNSTFVYENNQNGCYLTYASPFATTSFIVTEFAGVQKTRTYGDIILKAVDATTGEETLLARFTRDETNPQYRRYLLTGLPRNCCSTTDDPATVQVTALAKLEVMPVVRPTDFLIIQSKEALILQAQANRLAGADGLQNAAQAENYHNMAVRQLQNDLKHAYGPYNPAVVVAPFGTVRPVVSMI